MLEVKAIEDFVSNDFEKLAFQKGEVISVLNNNNPSKPAKLFFYIFIFFSPLFFFKNFFLHFFFKLGWWEGQIMRKGKLCNGIFPSYKVSLALENDENENTNLVQNNLNPHSSLSLTDSSNLNDRKQSLIQLGRKTDTQSTFILKTGFFIFTLFFFFNFFFFNFFF